MYPPDWVLKEGRVANYPSLGSISFYVDAYKPSLGEHSARDPDSMGVTVYNDLYLNSSSSLATSLQKLSQQKTDEGVISYQSIVFNGYAAYYEHVQGIAAGYNILIEHGGSYIYEIALGPQWTDLDSASGTVKNIIDTFDFLDYTN